MGDYWRSPCQRFGPPVKPTLAGWRGAHWQTKFRAESEAIRPGTWTQTTLDSHRHLWTVRFREVGNLLYEYPARLVRAGVGGGNGHQRRAIRAYRPILRSRLPARLGESASLRSLEPASSLP